MYVIISINDSNIDIAPGIFHPIIQPSKIDKTIKMREL